MCTYSVQCTNLSLVSSVQAIVDVAREVLGVLSTVLLFQIDLGGTVSGQSVQLTLKLLLT